MFENKYYDTWWEEMETKRKYPVLMEWHTYRQAQGRFQKYEASRRPRQMKGFYDFLDPYGPYVARYCNENQIRVSREVEHKIRLCLSPHYMALLKAHHYASMESNNATSRDVPDIC